MKSLSPSELSELLSLAVDGVLDEQQKSLLEELVARDPSVARELNERLKLKGMMGSAKRLPPDPYFWTRLSQALERQAAEEANLLPFPRKYLPLASTLGILAFVALGITVFVQREPLMDYLTEQTTAMQEAYENSILKGSIMPLFANIGNDDVLQYALYGTLPLDPASETALRVDEGAADGYRIEVGLTDEQRPPKVTVKDFLQEVRPSEMQAVRIDSLLEEARKQIEQSAFYSENNALAIDPELIRLNRAVLAKIVSVLEPQQRRRFDRFLEERNASYAIAAGNTYAPSPREPEQIPDAPMIAPGHMRDYIVITPDSFAVTALGFNIDSVMKPWVEVRDRIPDMERRLETLVRSRAHQPPRTHLPRKRPGSPVRVVGEADLIKIELDAEFMAVEAERAMRVVVQPRSQRDKFFRFEFRTGPTVNAPGAPDSPGSINIQSHLDSMMMELQLQHESELRKFMDMDSLYRQKMKSQRRQRTAVQADTLR